MRYATRLLLCFVLVLPAAAVGDPGDPRYTVPCMAAEPDPRYACADHAADEDERLRDEAVAGFESRVRPNLQLIDPLGFAQRTGSLSFERGVQAHGALFEALWTADFADGPCLAVATIDRLRVPAYGLDRLRQEFASGDAADGWRVSMDGELLHAYFCGSLWFGVVGGQVASAESVRSSVRAPTSLRPTYGSQENAVQADAPANAHLVPSITLASAAADGGRRLLVSTTFSIDFALDASLGWHYGGFARSIVEPTTVTYLFDPAAPEAQPPLACVSAGEPCISVPEVPSLVEGFARRPIDRACASDDSLRCGPPSSRDCAGAIERIAAETSLPPSETALKMCRHAAASFVVQGAASDAPFRSQVLLALPQEGAERIEHCDGADADVCERAAVGIGSDAAAAPQSPANFWNDRALSLYESADAFDTIECRVYPAIRYALTMEPGGC